MAYTPSKNFLLSAFGEQLVVQPTVEVQAQAVYGLGAKVRSLNSGSGTALAENSLYKVETGTTAGSFGNVFSKRSLVYRAGQGSMGRITAAFIANAVGTNSRCGLINSTDEFSFGYDGDVFSILHRYDGAQEIQELQVTTAATSGGGEVATVTIDGTGYPVTLTASTVQQNAYEIADQLQGVVPLWNFQSIDDTVVMRSLISTEFGGAYTFSSATAVAVFTQILEGVDATFNWIPMDEWNGHTFDDFDPALGNVYQIDYQWLGFGNVRFWIEDPETGEFEVAHMLKYANTKVTPSVSNPTFRIGWFVNNSATTSDIALHGSSLALFSQGERVFTEEARSTSNTKTGVGSGVLTNILTIKVREVFGDKVNLNPVIPELFSVETDSTKSTTFKLIKNADADTGTPDYQYTNKDESIVIYDTGVTQVSGGTEIGSIVIDAAGSERIQLRDNAIELLPNESLTIAGEISSGAASELGASVVWQEDI